MTVNKNEIITLPKWLVILVLPMLVSAIMTISIISNEKGTYNEKVNKHTIEIEALKMDKIDRNELNFIIPALSRIEGKLDTHILTHNEGK